MFEQTFSLMDLIQIAATVGTCWFCYVSGRKHGIIMALESVGVIKPDEEQQNEEN
jgi:hypothetical protein